MHKVLFLHKNINELNKSINKFQFQFNANLYSALGRLHTSYLLCFTMFPAQVTLSILCHSFLRGSHPLPDQLPGDHTGLLSQLEQCLFLSFGPSVQDMHIHSLLVDRSMVVGHVLMDHMFSFMCTNHIDMTAHSPAFLQVG